MPKPLILIALANDNEHPQRYLKWLPEHERVLRLVLRSGYWDITVLPNVTPRSFLDVLQHPEEQERLLIVHFVGHAGDNFFNFEAHEGGVQAVQADVLAGVLGKRAQHNALKLVFLSGCRTFDQLDLLHQAGVPAAIATSRPIYESESLLFSEFFYKSLIAGHTLEACFDNAKEAWRFCVGDLNEGLPLEERLQDYGSLIRLDAIPATTLDVTQTTAEYLDPWRFKFKPYMRKWRLGQALNDPLWQLPLPEDSYSLGGLAEGPYLGLRPFERKDAQLFGGRGQSIRDVYDALSNHQITVLYGQSGVGKTSLLQAGVLPRLENTYHPIWFDCANERAMPKTLLTLLCARLETGHNTLDGAWRAFEQSHDKPLLLMLDQFETVYTESALNLLVKPLQALFAAPQNYPRGKLLFSLRQEWAAELLKWLPNHNLDFVPISLTRMDRPAVIAAIEKPNQEEKTRNYFRLDIQNPKDQLLTERIADDLLADPNTPVAPMLQLLLQKMWRLAYSTNSDAPCFDLGLYEKIRDHTRANQDHPGNPQARDYIDDFLGKSLEQLEEKFPQESGSGLVLDLLYQHTAEPSQSANCTLNDLKEHYSHIEGARIDQLVKACIDKRLLVESRSRVGEQERTTRLIHDTLASRIRRRYQDSDQPGQRARRILEGRVREINANPNTILPADDLVTVERGKLGMRRWGEREQALVKHSKEVQENRKKRVFIGAGLVVLLLGTIVVGGGFLWLALQKSLVSQSRTLAQDAIAAASNGHKRLGVLLAKAALPDTNSSRPFVPEAKTALWSILQTPGLIGELHDTQNFLDAVFDPNMRSILTASEDGTARLWDIETGTLLHTLQHGRKVWKAHFSLDGQWVVTASADKTARLWDTKTGKELHTLEHEGEVWNARFSRDGRWVATASMDTTARLWEAQTGKLLQTLEHDDKVGEARFSSDGRWVATASMDTTARLWEAQTGKLLQTLEHDDKVWDASFSPDGQWVVTASEDGMARLWEAQTGKLLQTLEHDDKVWDASFSPDGQWVMTASADKTARLWDSQTGTRLHTLQHDDDVIHASFSHDGKWMVTSSEDGTAALWETQSGRQRYRLTLPHRENVSASPVVNVHFSRNDQRVVTVSLGSTIGLWDIQTGKPLQTLPHKGKVKQASFSPDGQRVVTASMDTTARLWEAQTGTRLHTLEHAQGVLTARFSRDSQRVVTASMDTTARLWEAQTGKLLQTLQHGGEVWDASFSPDGQRVATASADKTARLWDTKTGKELHTLEHAQGVLTARFSCDGQWVATASMDKTARLWDAQTGELIHTLVHKYPVWGADFSCDGQWVATASEDNTARLWDAQTGELIHTLMHNNNFINVRYIHARFSPDDQQVVTASEDNTARLWDTQTGKEIHVLNHSGDVINARFSPDGQWVATASEDNTARLWDAQTGELIHTIWHKGEVWNARFSRDGHWVVTASGDGNAYLTAFVNDTDRIPIFPQELTDPERNRFFLDD